MYMRYINIFIYNDYTYYYIYNLLPQLTRPRPECKLNKNRNFILFSSESPCSWNSAKHTVYKNQKANLLNELTDKSISELVYVCMGKNVKMVNLVKSRGCYFMLFHFSK